MRNLDYAIAKNEQNPLTTDEAELAAKHLYREDSIVARAFLWRLLISGQPFTGGHSMALKCLARHNDPHRALAANFLMAHYPDMMPEVFRRYQVDEDAELKYVLAQYIQPSDPERAKRMMLDALPTASHETYDAISLELWDLGTSSDLAELRERDRSAGGNTVFASMAEMLAAKLSQNSSANTN